MASTIQGIAERTAGIKRALAAVTLCEAFQTTAAENAEQVALRTPGGAVSITWGEYSERVRSIAAGLASLGLRRGDRVALMMINRPEFNVCDSAAMHLGATAFSIYNTSSPDQIQYLFSNAGNRIVICEQQFVDTIERARDGTSVEHVICIDGGNPDGTISLEEVERAGDPAFDFETAWRAVEPDDILTLIYTSGTTGPPKGVELTHGNMMAEIRALAQLLPIEPGARITSFLPSAHIADRWSTHYTSMAFGLQITCIANPRDVVATLPEVRPTVWGSVPRIWEKMKAALEAGIEAEPDEQRKEAAKWAIGVGLRKVKAEQAGQVPDDLREEYEKADAVVLKGIREKIGLDQCKWLVVGAAPTPPEVLEFFAALGLEIRELWGMSETSAVSTINPPGRVKIGTVGPPIPDVELRLADDGEILVRGPMMFRGYRNEPEKTAETIDSDGWVHTGDIGEIDEDGYLKIVDRKKELIINAAGKNMSPANIEAKVKASSSLIGQAIAIGDRRPYNVALVTLDPDAAPVFAKKNGLGDPSVEALSVHPAVIEEVQRGTDAANAGLSRVEQIKKFTVLPTDWQPGGDELTPTMKLKRKPIHEKYASEIEALYAS
jgi:long-subunit acyl-CoA synthetase (AMP-forming)